MASSEDLELELSAAMSHATKDDGELEHPWYGIWVLVLRSLCRIQRGQDDGWYIVPVIYPQDPVVRIHVDLRRLALQRQAVAPSPPSPSERRRWANIPGRVINLGPSTPPSSSYSQSATNLLGPPLELPVKLFVKPKKRKLTEVNSDSEDVEATPTFEPSAVANRDLDSRRYPDFSRIISFYAPHLLSPIEIRDLIVENKLRILVGHRSKVYRWMHNATIRQTVSQAWHAFQSDINLKTIGCIMAYGEFWTYEEYRRENVSDPTIAVPGNEDEYVPSDEEFVPSDEDDASESDVELENTRAPPSALSKEINGLFNKQMWLKLCTPESDYMLVLIEKRLREINWDFWSQVTPPESQDSEEEE